MRQLFAIAFTILAAWAITPNLSAQTYAFPQPVIGTPVVPPQIMVNQIPMTTGSACTPQTCAPSCGFPAGDCNCKQCNKNCEPRLCSPFCRTLLKRDKRPLSCEIVGKIPLHRSEGNCRSLYFEGVVTTKVPQVHCTNNVCVEIGTKLIKCLENCFFEVCIPVAECCESAKECKLVDKPMKVRVYKREDPRFGTVFDVHVINDVDPASNFHAGGMPKEWVILSCATIDQLKSKCPQVSKLDGTKLFDTVADAKSEPTEADTDIRLVKGNLDAQDQETVDQLEPQS